MKKNRITELASHLWAETFTMLDAEPEVDADYAGHVATAVEKAFLAACIKMEGGADELR